MLVRGSPRAAYFFEAPDYGTFRYRVYNICQSLSVGGVSGPSAAWFHCGDLDRIERVLDRCDVLVLCRVHYTDRINRMVARARARGRRVLFDVDDLVFDLRWAHTLLDTLEVELNHDAWQFWFAEISRIGTAMSLCDGVVVTNPYLAARAEAFLGKPARIIPNYMNREQMGVSTQVWDAKEQSGRARDGRIHLGYFSGTATHNRDFALIAGSLAQVMDEDERLTLRVVGFLDGIGPELDRHCGRIEMVPLQDFLNLQREIGRVEVNLVPLQDNVFTNCKSELKWFEAAAVGAVTIATPTYAFRHAIEHRENGWLAPAYAWEAVLREVIGGGEDVWSTIAARAHADAEKRFSWGNQTATIRAALFDW
jgi:glycosyltransferase involved in cell wall biosynthesis